VELYLHSLNTSSWTTLPLPYLAVYFKENSRIRMAQVRDQWGVSINTVMKLRPP
jgi:hypothetical protein